MLLLRILAILIRVYAFYSPVLKRLSDLLIFNNLNNLRESILEYNFVTKLGLSLDTQLAVIIFLLSQYFHIIYFLS
jgi:hypothetical protein